MKIDLLTTRLSDHLKSCLIPPMAGNYRMSYPICHFSQLKDQNLLCIAGYVHMQCFPEFVEALEVISSVLYIL